MISMAGLVQRYGPRALLLVAVVLAIVIPPDTRTVVWAWLMKGLNAMDVIAIVGVYRLMSNIEHRRTSAQLTGIGDQLANGIRERLGRIERKIGIEE